jgi:hypothetical protein
MPCQIEQCLACRFAVTCRYDELRKQGLADREAFFGCVDLVEGLRPGFPRDYYFSCVGQLLGGADHSWKALAG